ncbi:MAG: hypothetical protein ACRDRS_01680 [Pseudonocardiaceae bacterium]
MISVPNGFDGVSPPIAAQLRRATGHPLACRTARSRRELYERLHQADAALVTTDNASAGILCSGPTRERGVTALHTLLRLVQQPG